MMGNAPRLLLAGTGSGCGKTTVTSALLRALQRRGTPLAAFKCGPDYIDPMFHTAVLGIPSRNLDLFFVDEAAVCGQLARHVPADGAGIIEGVMGFYDGISGTSDAASAAHLARATDTPRCWSCGRGGSRSRSRRRSEVSAILRLTPCAA